MRAYAEDLRERTVHCVGSGQDVHEVAARFEVSARTVWRYLKQQREEGHLHAKPHPGSAPRRTAEQVEVLREQLHQYPGLTLVERVDLLEAEVGVRVSVATMHRLVKKLRYSRKRAVSAPSNGTRRNAGRS